MEPIDYDKPTGMVIYTDGGARPNPGWSGSGGHGYVYVIGDETPVKPMPFPGDEATIYALATDAGYQFCSKDGVIKETGGKKAVPVNIGYIFEMINSSSSMLTNNYAEINSFLNALRFALQRNVKKLAIFSDSSYTVEGVTKWLPGWASRGWVTANQEPIKNEQLWRAVHQALSDIKDSGCGLQVKWVRAHNGNPGNENADWLATIGINRSIRSCDDQSVVVYTRKSFLEPKIPRHPLLSLKRIYFNREKDRNIEGVYYMADPGKDDHLVGKPLAETVYAVVKLKEPDPIIQAVLDAQYRYGQDFNATMMIKVENLWSPTALRLLSSYGSDALIRSSTNTSVMLPSRAPMTLERNPVGITLRAVDSINSLERILDQYVALSEGGIEENHNDMSYYDITDRFYDVSEVKKGAETRTVATLQKEFGVGIKNASVTLDVTVGDKVRTITFPLILGADLPDRNNLKRLETSDPSIKLITWRDSKHSLSYACVLSCNEGMAIWSNFYATRLVFKD